MAKSLFEPKKVVRYVNNQEVIEGGLGSAPTPSAQRSATRPVPKTQAIPAEAQKIAAANIPSPAPPQSSPSPAPPVPTPETRAFFFDGATELTGSFSTKGGSTVRYGNLAFTARPGWPETTTGSFTIFSINNPTDDTDYKRSFQFVRVSGSGGYEDRIVSKFSKGSENQTHTWKNPLSPNFYSGSVGFKFFQILFQSAAIIGRMQVDNKTHYATSNTVVAASSSISSTAVYGASKTVLNANDYEISIGGHNSGSSEYFSGSIANLALIKNNLTRLGSSMPRLVVDNQYVDIVYKFEGNVSASKGNKDLGVAGTETYVSSSI